MHGRLTVRYEESMSGNILTPTTIWKDFNISFIPSAKIVQEFSVGKKTYTKLYIDGQTIGEEKVEIFATLVKGSFKGKKPAILLLQDFEYGFDDALVSALVDQGYVVLSIDIAGQNEDNQHTVYPEQISYANYKEVANKLFEVEGDVTETCWYEWVCATRHALKYLVNLPFVSKVGGFGIGKSATVMWQVVATDEKVCCATFALNAGWAGYKNIYKFSGKGEPHFSNNMYKYIAGIEPQSYAMHVKCPILMLSATNSDEYDCDRALDTVSRTAEGVFKATHYSVNYRNRVSGQAFENAILFFDEFLSNQAKGLVATSDISCEIVDGVIEVKVMTASEVKKVELYASEEVYKPSERCWQLVCDGKKEKDGVYKFTYSPYHKSNQVTFFAQIYYKNKFVSSTKIINKKFEEKEVLPTHKTKILYSSRLCFGESAFSSANQDLEDRRQINLDKENRVQVKKGAKNIEGVCSKWGLLTFKFATKRDMPIDGSILMFDVCSKTQTNLTVKLISDYFGESVEYMANIKIIGGDIWQNVQIESNKFKTAEGLVLKTYEKINAMAFENSGEEFLLNNVLWV